jgi:hypothetical protein
VAKLAVSDRWLVDRRDNPGGDVLEVRPIASPAQAREILSVGSPNQIGRPSLDGDRVAFDVVRGTSSQIVVDNVQQRTRRVVRRGRQMQFLNPSLFGSRLLYVAVTRCRQELLLSRPGNDRVLMRRRPQAAQDVGREPGHTSQGSRRPCPGGARPPGQDVLWSTALGANSAFVTLLRAGSAPAPAPLLLSVPR